MKVSVEMITFNHERFIAQAIDSVLMQETDFDYELVIGEDCSTDRTREIVVDYHRRHPDRIRVLLPQANLGAHENSRQTRAACCGEYIALLEGDDYWTDPHKLQKQVDFLDTHAECASCFHPVWKVCEDGDGAPLLFPENPKPVYGLKDLMGGNFIPTCSVLFRSDCVGRLPDWYHEMPVGDWPLHVLIAQRGEIGCIAEPMGVYRVHSSSVTSLRSPAKRLKDFAVFYDTINAHLGHRYERITRRSMARQWEVAADQVARVAFEQGSLDAALSSLRQTFADWPPEPRLSDRWKAKMVGRTYALFAFAAYQARDQATMRWCLPRAVAHDLSLLANSGILSIGLETLVGRGVAECMRNLARGLELTSNWKSCCTSDSKATAPKAEGKL